MMAGAGCFVAGIGKNAVSYDNDETQHPDGPPYSVRQYPQRPRKPLFPCQPRIGRVGATSASAGEMPGEPAFTLRAD